MDITILAVTKRYNSVCIAGVDEQRKWIRPVKEGELSLENIRVSRNDYVSIGNRYKFTFSGQSPLKCQTENYTIDTSQNITHITTLTETQKRELFLSLSESSLVTSNPTLDITQILKSRNRSLVLLGPVKVQRVYIYKNGNMKSPNITFNINSINVKGPNNRTDLPCTDLKFRAFAKNLLRQRNTTSITLEENELKDLLGYNQIFIVIDLTTLFRGENWPMSIGVHTLPDYNQPINYNDL